MNKIKEFSHEEKQAALEVAGELMQWKFFEMNDCDTVAAKSEEEAKVYYEQFISREEIDEQFGGERKGDFVISSHIGDLTDEEYAIIKTINPEGRNGEQFYATALQWLELWLATGHKDPFIIASTEY